MQDLHLSLSDREKIITGLEILKQYILISIPESKARWRKGKIDIGHLAQNYEYVVLRYLQQQFVLREQDR